MKKTLKTNLKKFIILNIIVVLMALYMPSNEIYGYTNGISQKDLQIEETEKNANKIQNNNEIKNDNAITETDNEVLNKDLQTEETEKNANKIQNNNEIKNDETDNEVLNKDLQTEETEKNVNKIQNNNEIKNDNAITETDNEQNNDIDNNKTKQTEQKILNNNLRVLNAPSNNSVRASYSDLGYFVTEASIFDKNGTPVTSIIPNETYSIRLTFRETSEKQFTTNVSGTMTYKLPEFVKVLHGIENQNIVSSEGITLGEYSIADDGLVTVKWHYVDREGNEINDLYIDHYEDAFLILTFDSKLSAEIVDEEIVIDFGNNVTINVKFDDDYSLVVNKEATINNGKKYDTDTYSINYNTQLITYGDMKSLQLEDIVDNLYELDTSELITITYKYSTGSKTTTWNLTNYPNSIKIDNNTIYNTEINKYITINNDGFSLNFTPNGEIIPTKTEIIVNYTTKLKSGVLASNNGVINYDVKNTVTGKGVLNSNCKSLTDTDTETVNINVVKLLKYGQFIEKGYPGIGNTEDVIIWAIQIGDGSTIINGTTIEDTLGDGLEFALDQPAQLILYDANGKQYFMVISGTVLKGLAQQFGMTINRNVLTWTVPSNISGNNVEIYKAEIYYCTNYETSVSTGYDMFTNKVTGVGPIGEVETTGKAYVSADLIELNKKVEAIKTGDSDISYSIEMSVPASYYKKPLAIYDLTELHIDKVWNGSDYVEQVYHVNYEDISEYFENNIKITAKTQSGKDITFENFVKNPYAPYTYFIGYSGVSNYGQVVIIFNGYDTDTSSWNINEDSVINIEYKIPLNSAVYDRNEPTNPKGTIEQYSGEKILNIVEALTVNEATGQFNYMGKDQVEIGIPSTLKKDYSIINNTNIASFNIVVNKEGLDLAPESDTLTVIDTMSPALEFLGNTLGVYKYNDQTGKYDIKIENIDFSQEKDINTGETIARIVVPDGEKLELRYNCLMVGTGVVAITNLARIEGVIGTTSKTDYSFEVQNSSAVSGGSESGLDFYILKYGETSDGKILLSGVQFELLKLENGQKVIIGTPRTDASGKIELDDMSSGTYYLKELSTIEPDYIKLDGEITIIIDDNNNLSATYKEGGVVQVLTDQNSVKYVEVINKKQETLEISGIKTWEDDNNKWELRPESIIVNVLANGEKIDSKTVTANDNWEYKFVNLPKTDKDGKEVVYTISEDTVKGYKANIEGNNITNTLETVEISGIKTWEDDNNKWELRPESIIVNLLANGEKIDSKTVTANDNWEYKFVNLPKTDKKGNGIVYTISEDTVEYYMPIINEYNITNKLKELENYNYFNEQKEILNTPKTGNENFLGASIITAIMSAIGIVITKKYINKDQ